jgi:signal transduction histidine kinase
MDGEFVAIDVADNGEGISEDILARIFEPFFTTKPQGKGTGLGLAICRDIVVQHGRGHIRGLHVPGQGSTFHVRLPMRPRGLKPHPPTSPGEAFDSNFPGR